MEGKPDMGAGSFKGSGGKKSGVNNRDLDRTGSSQQSLFGEEDNVMNHMTPSSNTNKFSDTKTWPTKLEEGKLKAIRIINQAKVS